METNETEERKMTEMRVHAAITPGDMAAAIQFMDKMVATMRTHRAKEVVDALSAALSGMAEPVAWRWAWKTTGSPLERRFADPDLYMWTYGETPPINASNKIVEPLFAAPPVSDLREENARLRKALEPFSAVAENDIGDDETDNDLFAPMTRHNRAPSLTVGDMRRAYAALNPEGK